MKKLFLGALLFFVFASWANACSCMLPWKPAEELEKSDYVFTWNVIKIEESSDQRFFSPDNSVTISVNESYKWGLDGNIIVTTAWDSAACGYNFEENKEYFVYASKFEDQVSVSLCSKTSLLSNASESVDKLEYLLVKSEDSAETITWSWEDKGDLNWLTIVISVMLFGGVALWGYMMSRKS